LYLDRLAVANLFGVVKTAGIEKGRKGVLKREKDDEDRELFLKTLGQACAKTGW